MKEKTKKVLTNGVRKATSSFRYGIGMFGTSLAINMFRGRAMAFWTTGGRLLTLDDLGIITMVYTFLDMIDNPVYGFLSDNTRTRYGRRKPWLVIGAPLFTVFFILFFSAPESLSRTQSFAWAMTFYFVAGTLDSLINANYGALFPELFPTEKQRTKTNAIRQIAQLFAMVLGIAVVPMLLGALGTDTPAAQARAYRITAVIYGLISMAVMLFMSFGVHEPKPKVMPKTRLKPTILAVIKSYNFWMVSGANAFYSAAMGLVMASIPFYVKYSLNLSTSNETFLLGTVILVAVVGVAIWSLLVRKFGARKVWSSALIVLAISFIPIYLAQNLLQAILASVLVGLGFSGVISTMDLMGAKVLDEDYAKYGIKREGVFSSIMGFFNRLSGVFIAIGLFLASTIYGFKNENNPGERPDEASRFMLALFPLVMTAIGIVFTFLVRFNEDKTRADIEKWRDEAMEEDKVAQIIT